MSVLIISVKHIEMGLVAQNMFNGPIKSNALSAKKGLFATDPEINRGLQLKTQLLFCKTSIGECGVHHSHLLTPKRHAQSDNLAHTSLHELDMILLVLNLL